MNNTTHPPTIDHVIPVPVMGDRASAAAAPTTRPRTWHTEKASTPTFVMAYVTSRTFVALMNPPR